MARVHYCKTECFHCGMKVTTNGMGRASHMRKHVREGLLVEVEGRPESWLDMLRFTQYVTPAQARVLLAKTGSITYVVIAGDMGTEPAEALARARS